MLSDSEVRNRWRQLFSKKVTAETVVNAEKLLSELSPENPLRHRLGKELKEIRRIHKVAAT